MADHAKASAKVSTSVKITRTMRRKDGNAKYTVQSMKGSGVEYRSEYQQKDDTITHSTSNASTQYGYRRIVSNEPS